MAACDGYDGRLAHMRELYGDGVFTTRDYHEILARKDIDAVIVGTPDHWHRQVTIDAIKAGKDVYCEKPMVQHIDDGHPVVEAQKSSDRIVQIGSQRVSSVLYDKARQLYQSGAIGTLTMVEAWWDRNSAIGAWEYTIPPDANTTTCDWPQFEGRAPKTAWDPKRFFRWRCYQDYGTGVAGDLFVHLFSGLHFITGAKGPDRVMSTGGLRFWKDGRDVPDVLVGMFDYPGFTLVLRVNFACGAEESEGFRFSGSEGVMTVGRNVTLSRAAKSKAPGYTIDTFSKPVQADYLKQYRAQYPESLPTAADLRSNDDEVFSAPSGYSDHRDHHRRFAEAIRSRKPVVEDAVFGFRAAGPALLCNLSYFERRTIAWDPETMTVKA